MSLINDAIKQAHKANKERQPGEATTAPGAGMQTAASRPGPAPGGSMTGMLIIAGIVVFVLLGGALLFLSLRNTPQITDLDDPLPRSGQVAKPAATSPAPEPAPAISTAPPVDPTASALNNPIPAPVAVSAPSVPATEAIPAGPRPFPELKLQGIYYRLNDPSVMINGKALELGDLIDGAKVVKIDRKEVTLEFEEQQKVLRLQ